MEEVINNTSTVEENSVVLSNKTDSGKTAGKTRRSRTSATKELYEQLENVCEKFEALSKDYVALREELISLKNENEKLKLENRKLSEESGVPKKGEFRMISMEPINTQERFPDRFNLIMRDDKNVYSIFGVLTRGAAPHYRKGEMPEFEVLRREPLPDSTNNHYVIRFRNDIFEGDGGVHYTVDEAVASKSSVVGSVDTANRVGYSIIPEE